MKLYMNHGASSTGTRRVALLAIRLFFFLVTLPQHPAIRRPIILSVRFILSVKSSNINPH